MKSVIIHLGIIVFIGVFVAALFTTNPVIAIAVCILLAGVFLS